jgi:hypothetical protein
VTADAVVRVVRNLVVGDTQGDTVVTLASSSGDFRIALVVEGSRAVVKTVIPPRGGRL